MDIEDELNLASISLHRLKIWVKDSADELDGDLLWLDTLIECSEGGSRVAIRGAYMSLDNLQSWLIDIKELQQKTPGDASLSCWEPNLVIKLSVSKLGSMATEVFITPCLMSQEHVFRFELDQSYLEPFARDLKRTIDKIKSKKVSSP